MSFVPVKVTGLAVDARTKMPLVLLEDEAGARTLPIWIGVFEASAIATELQGIALARPMSHDLMKSLISALGGAVARVEIHDLRENTFHARLVMTREGPDLEVDARPSDAIALALRFKAPILVAESVLAAAKAEGQVNPADSKEQLDELLKNLSDEAFGKYKM